MTHLVLILFLCFVAAVPGGEVRISFLSDEDSQREAVDSLQNFGVSDQSRTQYSRAVRDYYAEPPNLGLSQFPSKENGSYVFASIDDLLLALPTPLWETTNRWTFNCFDTVILILGENVSLSLESHSLSGPFFAVVTGSEKLSILPTATPEDAFSLTYPPWYRERSSTYFPTPKDLDRRICLIEARII